MKKVTGNQDVRDSAKAFFALAETQKCQTTQAIADCLQSGCFRMSDGIIYQVTAELTESLWTLIANVVKVCGVKAADEKKIAEVAWSVAAINDAAKRPSKFAELVDFEVSSEHERILPCCVVELNGIDDLRLGDVTIERCENVAKELNKQSNPWAISTAEAVGTKPSGGKFTIALPRVVFRVKVACSKGNVDDNAIWKINIALSLLRLSLPTKRTTNISVPRNGEVEANPIAARQMETLGITLSPAGASFGGGKMLGCYKLDGNSFSEQELLDIDKKARELMSAPKDSVEERVSRGLAWLSKGRQADNLEERFLALFTAVEALLSTNDKSSPVTDTLARGVATILCAKLADRAEVADKISNLYAFRSELVHRGNPNVAALQAEEIQDYAERLYMRVLKEVDLSEKVSDFHKKIKSAGFGTQWPPCPA